jgi:hypothetical protein
LIEAKIPVDALKKRWIQINKTNRDLTETESL